MFVYTIINTVTGGEYIGSTVNFKSRKSKHLKDLNRNIHHSKYLQNYWNKYGSDAFEFIIIERVDDSSKLLEREQFNIDNSNSIYNTCKVAGSPLGIKRSQETKNKISKSNTGRKFTKDQLERRSKSQSGENHYLYNSAMPDCTKKKISNTLASRFKNKENHPRYNKNLSNKSKKKISEGLKEYFNNNKHHNSGKNVDAAVKQKISNKLKKPINQYAMCGKLIKEWDSIKDASSNLGIREASIRDCCKNRRPNYSNYIWKFKN
jgi:group I intron endonuclease